MHGWAERDEGGALVGFLGAALRAAPPVWRRPPRGVGRALALGLLLLGGTVGALDAHAVVEGTMIDAGAEQTCAVGLDGRLACWGEVPILGINQPPEGTFSQVSAGYTAACAVRSDGTLACWGMNDYGQATPPAGRFTEVSVGGYHTCAVRDDGFLVCWGDNGPAPRTTLAPSCCLPDATAYRRTATGSSPAASRRA